MYVALHALHVLNNHLLLFLLKNFTTIQKIKNYSKILTTQKNSSSRTTKGIAMHRSLALIYLLLPINLFGGFGCMDNSYHADLSKGVDYKRFEYVQCNCPCDRYEHDFKRGKCLKCLHYRSPEPLIIVD